MEGLGDGELAAEVRGQRLGDETFRFTPDQLISAPFKVSVPGIKLRSSDLTSSVFIH